MSGGPHRGLVASWEARKNKVDSGDLLHTIYIYVYLIHIICIYTYYIYSSIL